MSGRERDDFAELSAMFGRPDAGGAPVPTAVGYGTAAPSASELSAARRRRIRRRIVSGSIALVIVALVATYIPETLLAPVPLPTVVLTKPTVAVPAATVLAMPPSTEAAVSIAGDDDFAALTGTKEMTAASGGTDALPIASISKLITAMVVLEAKPITGDETGPTITFSKADHDLYDKYYVMQASVQPMATGSRMTERDALKTMLIVSACNYAEAVSTWAFGSQANFLAATKKWLKAHSLSSTHMVEPTGVDARNVSTPADLVALGKIAQANPVIAKIVAMPTLGLPDMATQNNNNDLLGDDGINGIKTGTLEGAGSNLLFSASVDVKVGAPLNVVGVVLNGASREEVDADVEALIASLKSGFHTIPVVKDGAEVGTYTTQWGDSATITAGDSGSLLTWSNQPITATVKSTPVAKGTTGTHVGVLEFASPSHHMEVPLTLHGTITAPDAWWRLTHPQRLFGR